MDFPRCRRPLDETLLEIQKYPLPGYFPFSVESRVKGDLFNCGESNKTLELKMFDMTIDNEEVRVL